MFRRRRGDQGTLPGYADRGVLVRPPTVTVYRRNERDGEP
jgi:hypothetical protein